MAGAARYDGAGGAGLALPPARDAAAASPEWPRASWLRAQRNYVFNDQFQSCLDRVSDSTVLNEFDTFTEISRLAKDFQHSALMYGRVIVYVRTCVACRDVDGVSCRVRAAGRLSLRRDRRPPLRATALLRRARRRVRQ